MLRETGFYADCTTAEFGLGIGSGEPSATTAVGFGIGRGEPSATRFTALVGFGRGRGEPSDPGLTDRWAGTTMGPASRMKLRKTRF